MMQKISHPHPQWNDVTQRRNFIKGSAAALALSALPIGMTLAAKQPTAIGLQLYTLRDFMQTSLPATLKLVAAVGYQELEFAGYFDHKPKEVRSILDSEGLTAPSAHVMLDAFEQSTAKVIDAALTVGHKYLVIPYLNEAQRGNDIQTYERLAERFNLIGEECKRAGLQLAYHNHEFEFEKRAGRIPFDVLLEQTEPDLMAMEIDLYWVAKANHDPVAYFNKYPGRFPLWHVKDMDAQGDFADLGKGVIDFKPIFAKSELAGVKHRFVERDQSDNRLETIQQGYKALKALIG